jgi:hypothetical protein
MGMHEEAASGAEQTSGAAAHYIAALSGELAHIARGHGLQSLAYILDMARLEADQIAKSSAKIRRGRVRSIGR